MGNPMTNIVESENSTFKGIEELDLSEDEEEG